MASVWVARLRGKRGFEKLVAIKTILPKFAQDPRFERMFLDEAGLAARIEHANVAQVLDLGEEHEVLYLAMELVEGDSLSKLLRVVQKKDIPIPTGIILRILADTCGGLHAAHELRDKDGELLNVVHRDVSPQNILVSMRGVAKLIDFGIAKARDRASEDTSDGMLKGKIHYMAPEQALGKHVDRRADVWAVGAILYSLLAGKPPFEGENHVATLHMLGAGRPPLPLPPSVHPAVSAIARRSLMHAPDERFATAAEMQAAIEMAMVTADLVTTTSDVAAFVQEHMAERAKKRKEGMDLALSAASQRAKIAGMLERAGADSSTGQVGVPYPSGSGEVPAVDGSYATVMLGTPAGAIDTPSATSSATRSALASSMAQRLELPRRYKVGATATLIAACVVVVLAVRRGPEPAPTLAATPPSPVVTQTEGPAPMPPPTSTVEAPGSPEAAASGSPPGSASAGVPKVAPAWKAAPPKSWAPPRPSSTKRQRADDGF
jgi:serine/threonine protein kinase